LDYLPILCSPVSTVRTPGTTRRLPLLDSCPVSATMGGALRVDGGYVDAILP